MLETTVTCKKYTGCLNKEIKNRKVFSADTFFPDIEHHNLKFKNHDVTMPDFLPLDDTIQLENTVYKKIKGIITKKELMEQSLINDLKLSLNKIKHDIDTLDPSECNAICDDLLETIKILQSKTSQKQNAEPTSWAARETKRQLLTNHISQDLTLTIPTEAPIRWSARANFDVEKITDDHVRQKLQKHPELVEQIRGCTTKNPMTFLNIIYGDYIKYAGLGQKELRYILDKTLWDICGTQCRAEGKELGDYLPKYSKQLDMKIEKFKSQGIVLDKDLQSAISANARR